MAKKAEIPEIPIGIVKVGTCPSLSGRSTLTYHLGSNAEGGLHCRVVQNSGAGQFNADWISVEDIRKRLEQHPAEKPLTSAVIGPVFRGRSSNSPAFLFAVLKAEGLVLAKAEKDGGYLPGDFEAFKSVVSALLTASNDPPTESPPETPKKKRPVQATASEPKPD